MSSGMIKIVEGACDLLSYTVSDISGQALAK